MQKNQTVFIFQLQPLFNRREKMNDLERFKIKNEERTKCEIWTRVMGYHRPIDSFNVGKEGEVAERKYFDQNKCRCGR